jgi:anti-sigma B factor antagonist
MSACGRRRADAEAATADGTPYGPLPVSRSTRKEYLMPDRAGPDGTDGAQTRRPPGAFGIADADLRGAPGVAVHGEVDVSAIPSLVEGLETAIRDSEGAFVIDLCDVEFLDSSGLSVLMRARALLGQEERRLAIVCPPGPVRRLFELAGISDLFFLYGSRDEAAAALVPAD